MCFGKGNEKDKTYDYDFDIIGYFRNYKVDRVDGSYKIYGKKRNIIINIYAHYRCINSCKYILAEGFTERLTLEEIEVILATKKKKEKKNHFIKSKKLRKLYDFYYTTHKKYSINTEELLDIIKEIDEGTF